MADCPGSSHKMVALESFGLAIPMAQGGSDHDAVPPAVAIAETSQSPVQNEKSHVETKTNVEKKLQSHPAWMMPASNGAKLVDGHRMS